MWIQVRTIDGAQTRTIDDLSRLTKIETLREKIQESFRVSPELQRLFYRGKQVRQPRQTLPLPPPSAVRCLQLELPLLLGREVFFTAV